MYESFYGLEAKPFQLSPDPRFFFGSRGHKRALAYLRYGLSLGEGFVVITGDVGTGKTTLVQLLLAELGRQANLTAAQVVTTQLEADDLLRMVSGAFGLTNEGLSKSALLRRFEAFLRQEHQAGRRVLLLLDEAQNLPPSSLEALRMLSNYQEGDQPLMQSFLLGQAEFRRTLASPRLEQMRQRVLASCHLAPLGPQETKRYVEHRLGNAGWKNDPELTSDAFDALQRHTEGVPRRINAFCDRMLLFGYLEGLHRLDRDTVEMVHQELATEFSGQGQTVKGSGWPGSGSGPQLVALESRIKALEEALQRTRDGLNQFLTQKP